MIIGNLTIQINYYPPKYGMHQSTQIRMMLLAISKNIDALLIAIVFSLAHWYS